jgi:hypothetical protein
MIKSISLKDFKKARDYMDEIVVETITNMEVGIYDPWLKMIFEKEMKAIINTQFKSKYPDIEIFFNFSVYLSSQTIEYSVQHYYHPFSQHVFLGSLYDTKIKRGEEKPQLVDCYYSSLYETFGEPRVIIRYGHEKKEADEGAANAAEQFYMGLDTMLAKAYQMALEAGYVTA